MWEIAVIATMSAMCVTPFNPGRTSGGRTRRFERLIVWADKVDPPSAASASPDSEDAEGATEEDVVTLAVDSPLGSVTGAIASLLWARPDAFATLSPVVAKLVTHQHSAIRYEAISICLPILNIDRPVAIQLMLKACNDGDERVLRSPWVNGDPAAHQRLSSEAGEGIIRRMVGSSTRRWPRMARVATVLHVRLERLTDSFEMDEPTMRRMIPSALLRMRGADVPQESR